MAVTVTFEGKNDDLLKKQKQVKDGADEVDKSFKEVAKETARLERIAKQAFANTRTEVEKLQAKMKDLQAASEKGLFAGKEDAFEKSIEQINKRMEELNEVQPGNPKSIVRFKAAETSMAGYAASIALVLKVLNDANAEADELAQKRFTGADSRGELAQVTTGPADFEQLLAKADQLLSRGAVRDQAAAYDALGAIRSGGLDADLETFARIGEAKLAGDIGDLARSVDTLKSALSGAGTSEQIISRALVAGTVAPGKLPDILRNIARVAPQGKSVGLSPDDVFFGQAVTSKVVGNNEQGKTAFDAFLRFVDKSGIKGNDLSDLVNKVEALTVTLGGEFKAIPDAEAVKGFRALRDQRELFDSLKSQSASVQAGAPLRERLDLLRGNNQTRPDQLQAAAEGAFTVALDPVARMRQLVNAQQQQRETLLAQRGFGYLARKYDRAIGEAAQFFGLYNVDSIVESDARSYERQQKDAKSPEELATLKQMASTLRQILVEQKTKAPKVPQPEAP